MLNEYIQNIFRVSHFNHLTISVDNDLTQLVENIYTVN